MSQTEIQNHEKILTLLFTDLESSTRLWQQFPEAMKIALARHDHLVRAAVEAANGRIVKSTGDGFFATFVSAIDGLRACIRVQQSLLDEPWNETGPLKVILLVVGNGGEKYKNKLH